MSKEIYVELQEVGYGQVEYSWFFSGQYTLSLNGKFVDWQYRIADGPYTGATGCWANELGIAAVYTVKPSDYYDGKIPLSHHASATDHTKYQHLYVSDDFVIPPQYDTSDLPF